MIENGLYEDTVMLKAIDYVKVCKLNVVMLSIIFQLFHYMFLGLIFTLILCS